MYGPSLEALKWLPLDQLLLFIFTNLRLTQIWPQCTAATVDIYTFAAIKVVGPSLNDSMTYHCQNNCATGAWKTTAVLGFSPEVLVWMSLNQVLCCLNVNFFSTLS